MNHDTTYEWLFKNKKGRMVSYMQQERYPLDVRVNESNLTWQ